jgi:hypothetical protein
MESEEQRRLYRPHTRISFPRSLSIKDHIVLLNVVSELLQCGDRSLNRGDNMKVDRPLVRRRDTECDPQFSWLALCELRPGPMPGRRSVGVAWKGSSYRIEIGGRCPDGSCVAESKGAAMPDVASWTRSRPRIGFSPTTPQQDAGTRIDPAASVASAIRALRDATAAAAPPPEPPGIIPSRHGFSVAP